MKNWVAEGIASDVNDFTTYYMQSNLLQDVSGPFLYGTLNRRPQMTLPRPRSDRLGSETSSITNHIDLPVMTSSISAYNNNTGMSGQDIWTPMAVHHSHPGHGAAQCGGGYQMPGTVGNGGPGNGSVASSLRSESPISSGKIFMLHRYRTLIKIFLTIPTS